MVRIQLPLQGPWVQSLVREPRSQKPCSAVKRKKTKESSFLRLQGRKGFPASRSTRIPGLLTPPHLQSQWQASLRAPFPITSHISDPVGVTRVGPRTISTFEGTTSTTAAKPPLPREVRVTGSRTGVQTSPEGHCSADHRCLWVSLMQPEHLRYEC